MQRCFQALRRWAQLGYDFPCALWASCSGAGLIDLAQRAPGSGYVRKLQVLAKNLTVLFVFQASTLRPQAVVHLLVFSPQNIVLAFEKFSSPFMQCVTALRPGRITQVLPPYVDCAHAATLRWGRGRLNNNGWQTETSSRASHRFQKRSAWVKQKVTRKPIQSIMTNQSHLMKTTVCFIQILFFPEVEGKKKIPSLNPQTLKTIPPWKKNLKYLKNLMLTAWNRQILLKLPPPGAVITSPASHVPVWGANVFI